MYYQDNNTEHHKSQLGLPSILTDIAKFLGKNRKQYKQKIFIVLATIICNNCPEKAVLINYW